MTFDTNERNKKRCPSVCLHKSRFAVIYSVVGKRWFPFNASECLENLSAIVVCDLKKSSHFLSWLYRDITWKINRERILNMKTKNLPCLTSYKPYFHINLTFHNWFASVRPPTFITSNFADSKKKNPKSSGLNFKENWGELKKKNKKHGNYFLIKSNINT